MLESDEEFFESLMNTGDLWDLRHYGNCLRLSGSGYHLSVFKLDSPDTVMIRVVKSKTGMRLDRRLKTDSELVYKESLKLMFNEIYQYLKENDTEALALWIKQLRSSVHTLETIERNSKIIVE